MSALSQFLREHLISCPSKKYLHLECPGCGLQRSIVLLLEGELKAGFLMYPALIPMILLLFTLLLHVTFKLKHGAVLLKYQFIFCVIVVVVSFVIKVSRNGIFSL